MSKEEQNYDTNEYDEESFDNESFEDVLSDEESIQEESSDGDGESLNELIPDNSSVKSSIDENQIEEIDYNEVSSISSESEDSNVRPYTKTAETSKINNEAAPCVCLKDTKETPASILNQGDDVDANVVEGRNASEFQTKTHSKTSPHEIDESESDDFEEEDLTENVKSLTIQNKESSPEVEVPKENPNLEIEKHYVADNTGDYYIDCDVSQASEIEFIVTSQTPTSFNSESYAFHTELTRKPTRSNTSLQQQRNTHRKSLSFSNERMREIERHNQILLRKILTQKPRKEFLNKKSECPKLRTTTSAVNRKKQQRQIDLDNPVLKRKIEAIALRRPKVL
ncbi:cilia- and flagella-associated protein 97 [Eupeodes corollae]|uniref:cilia- and flagella-associated protein 97 n=1 Tax=Eupeodes corollae TaxID=290404 RepID=UPI00249129C6|nr:cilia- and flagella-associated protein 97 [Eupeodes corollae]XP_055906743.1 cilia- and flagella-associated protein 97 [Eupeodes corollae]XP_055906744.1 cilia- and flagella-associated protein 97 [Eupeodes corollae]XP_055906745.1 cilia- and flagella-associated protein 97 [Eupeodes corollae]XP_055906746.1 cilia- and flagella-associated protein 97 [Eupeodes corollae]